MSATALKARSWAGFGWIPNPASSRGAAEDRLWCRVILQTACSSKPSPTRILTSPCRLPASSARKRLPTLLPGLQWALPTRVLKRRRRLPLRARRESISRKGADSGLSNPSKIIRPRKFNKTTGPHHPSTTLFWPDWKRRVSRPPLPPTGVPGCGESPSTCSACRPRPKKSTNFWPMNPPRHSRK